MPLSKYSKKQKKLAGIAEARDKITGADFKKLRARKKKYWLNLLLGKGKKEKILRVVLTQKAERATTKLLVGT